MYYSHVYAKKGKTDHVVNLCDFSGDGSFSDTKICQTWNENNFLKRSFSKVWLCHGFGDFI